MYASFARDAVDAQTISAAAILQETPMRLLAHTVDQKPFKSPL